MKKLFITAFALLACQAFSIAQGGYLRAGLGYAFSHAGGIYDLYGNPISGTINYDNNGTTYASYNVKKASFSAGMYADIAGGFMFNEHIGIDFALASGFLPQKYTYTGTNASISSDLGNTTVSQNAETPLLFTPSIVLQTGSEQAQIYTRVGLTLPLSARIKYEETDVFSGTGPYTNMPGETDNIGVEYKTSFSVGFSGAIGLRYKIGSQVSIYGELSMLSMSLYIKELNYTSVLINGSAASNTPVIPFGTSGSNVNPNTGTGTQITQDVPFSNVGFHAGIYYSFYRHHNSIHRNGGSKGRF